MPDSWGKLAAMRFRRAGGGELLELPARTCLVAAGTTPNITYAKEFPNAIPLDERRRFFAPHHAVPAEGGGWRLEPAAATDGSAFFTGYSLGGKLITFFGDNHPAYNGNVVKAMASAKVGYRAITQVLNGSPGEAPGRDPERDREWLGFRSMMEDRFTARVVDVIRLTPTIVEVVVRSPAAAENFQPGQFFRLQNLESYAPRLDGSPLLIEPLALTGAWVDAGKGLLSMIALELGASSRICSVLKPGEPVLAMGPTGSATAHPDNRTVLLCGGGLGTAVLCSSGQKSRELGHRVCDFEG